MASSGSTYVSFARHRLVFEWNIASQSIPSNNSVITGKLFLQSMDVYGAMYAPVQNAGSMTINGERRTWTNSSDLGANQKKLLFAGNWTIPHNADGTKSFSFSATYNINVTFNGVFYGNRTVSGGGTLNTIPRTSSVSVYPSTINFGDRANIHIDRASSSFNHTLTFKWYGNENTFADKINYVDTDITPSMDLSRYIPNETSGWGTIVCDTYSGETKIGSSSAKLTINTVDDSRFQPVINGFTISEGSPEVTTAVGAVYVQSKSKLKVDTNASSKMYSTISKIETKVGNATYTGNPIVSGFVAESGKLDIIVTVTDSRGYKATSSQPINLAPYSNPTTTISALRRKDAQEIIDITWSGTSKAIGVDNAMGYKIEYQQMNKSWILLEQNSSATRESWSGKIVKDAIDIDKVYNIRITMYDEFMSTVSTTVIPVAQVPMSWGTTGASVGKVFEEGKENFQVSGDMSINGKLLIDIFYPVGCIFESTSSENPANIMGGRWERFGNGRVTVGVDEGDDSINSGNRSVGSVNPLTSHSHYFKHFNGHQSYTYAWGTGSIVYPQVAINGTSAMAGNPSHNGLFTKQDSDGASVQNSGDNTNHNNWQPSVSVYRFRRIA
ncbi:tail protein [Lactococcus phage 949]|uniref:Putative tail protein n=1 Tax=Lactococcus phage 949 TaxID=881953 RepID=E0YJ14_9CAUD|nr:tail protein [Lactococcus phage 949]ADM73685.1 putative tail protein [Lactococcus phage 949]